MGVAVGGAPSTKGDSSGPSSPAGPVPSGCFSLGSPPGALGGVAGDSALGSDSPAAAAPESAGSSLVSPSLVGICRVLAPAITGDTVALIAVPVLRNVALVPLIQ